MTLEEKIDILTEAIVDLTEPEYLENHGQFNATASHGYWDGVHAALKFMKPSQIEYMITHHLKESI